MFFEEEDWPRLVSNAEHRGRGRRLLSPSLTWEGRPEVGGGCRGVGGLEKGGIQLLT